MNRKLEVFITINLFDQGQGPKSITLTVDEALELKEKLAQLETNNPVKRAVPRNCIKTCT